MKAAFEAVPRSKRDPRWIKDYPRLDRGTLARMGALRPGSHTSWALKPGPGVAAALSIELHALPDGIVLTVGDQVTVVRYRYDTVPVGDLRQFLVCPCGAIRRTLYFDRPHWGCRRCLMLAYPSKTNCRRTTVADRIAAARRRLIELSPGSREFRAQLARLAAQQAALAGQIERARSDLTKRLKRNHNRTVGESPVRAERRSAPRSGAGKPD
jgi:hypothetical protein